MIKHYHLSNIRALLIQGFNDEELRRLCYDVPHFRPVYDELARNTGKTAIIDRLLEYAEAKVLLDNLLTLAQKLNRAQFELHQPYYELSPDLMPSASPSAESHHTSASPAPSIKKSEPQINNPRNLPLPPGADIILKKMFADYWRVVILREFGGGFSGSRIFLVQPQHDPHVAELRAVIKLASCSLIEKEWRAYRSCICDQMPHITEVRGEPVFAESGWGGLRYLLLGSGVFDIESMYSFCRRASIEDIQFALGRLLKVIEPGVQFSQADPAFHLQASYDQVLPVNLLVEPASPPSGASIYTISPDNLPTRPLQVGDYVRLSGFVVTKVDLTHQSITLNRPTVSNGFPVSYCLRLQNLAGTMDNYDINQIIEPVEGRVIQTRAVWLHAEVQRALGQNFDLTDETILGPDGQNWLNPLTHWQDILQEIRQAKVACIHGDLNLENIIVDPAARDVHLIDFAEARRDHVLHDLLRLETEVVTKLIPEILHQHQLPAEIICSFYEYLHQVTCSLNPTTTPHPPHPALERPFAMLVALRRQARHCLFKPDDWAEYYQGLVLYLLGALKFANLDQMVEAPAPMPKQVAFWGAVTVVEVMKSSTLPQQNSNAQRERKMMPKDKSQNVIKLRDIKQAKLTIAGQDIIENAPPNVSSSRKRSGDAKIDIQGVEGGEHKVAIGNIIQYSTAVNFSLEEFTTFLSTTLAQSDELDYIREVMAQLKAETEKPVSERSNFRVNQWIKNIGTFLEQASLTTSQRATAQRLLATLKNSLQT